MDTLHPSQPAIFLYSRHCPLPPLQGQLQIRGLGLGKRDKDKRFKFRFLNTSSRSETSTNKCPERVNSLLIMKVGAKIVRSCLVVYCVTLTLGYCRYPSAIRISPTLYCRIKLDHCQVAVDMLDLASPCCSISLHQHIISGLTSSHQGHPIDVWQLQLNAPNVREHEYVD